MGLGQSHRHYFRSKSGNGGGGMTTEPEPHQLDAKGYHGVAWHGLNAVRMEIRFDRDRQQPWRRPSALAVHDFSLYGWDEISGLLAAEFRKIWPILRDQCRWLGPWLLDE